MPTTQTPPAASEKLARPINPAAFKLAARLQLSAAATPDAATVPVSIVARSGDAIDVDYWGAIVHDFAGMTVKDRIPLDYEHCDSIGFLDSFSTDSGDLVCGGAIVIVKSDQPQWPDVPSLVAKMRAGVPYEASIDFDDDMTLEIVPDGMTASVNGRTVTGPVTIVRQWTLKAVAVCKFGRDDDTSVELQFSKAAAAKAATQHKNQGQALFVRFASSRPATATKGEPMANEQTAGATPAAATKLSDQPGTAPATVATPAAAAAPATTVVTPGTTPAATDPAKPVADPAAPAQLSKGTANDGRAEFARFVSAFGAEKAATYFSAGKSFEDATAAHLQFQSQQIADLTTRLGAVDRGGEAALKLSQTAAVAGGGSSPAAGAAGTGGAGGAGGAGMQSVIRIGGAKRG